MTAPDSLIDRIMDALASGQRHPKGMLGVMEDDEVARGATVVPHGSVNPFAFAKADWKGGLITVLDGQARIIVIEARRPGTGALRRLIHGIDAAGLRPVVVEPVGRVMPAILKRWRWVPHRRGSGFEGWTEWSRP